MPVVVLDDQAARELFGDQEAIGRAVRVSEPAGVFTVTGTVSHGTNGAVRLASSHSRPSAVEAADVPLVREGLASLLAPR